MEQSNPNKGKNINKENTEKAAEGFRSGKQQGSQGMEKEQHGGKTGNVGRENAGNTGKTGQGSQQGSQAKSGSSLEYGQKEPTSDFGKGGRESRPGNRPSRAGATGKTEEE